MSRTLVTRSGDVCRESILQRWHITLGPDLHSVYHRISQDYICFPMAGQSWFDSSTRRRHYLAILAKPRDFDSESYIRMTGPIILKAMGTTRMPASNSIFNSCLYVDNSRRSLVAFLLNEDAYRGVLMAMELVIESKNPVMFSSVIEGLVTA